MSEDSPTFGRRAVASYFAASALLASACSRAPHETLVAYGQQPEQTPGVPRFFATTMSLGGYGTGLLVESHEGRPTKIEGNVDHPASLGGTSAIHQAQTLSLYDPDRLASPRRRGQDASLVELLRELGKSSTDSLDRVAILSAPTSSRVLASLFDEARARGARVFFHDSLPRTNVWEGANKIFGQPLEPLVDISQADVVLDLDADFLHTGPFHLRHARQRTARRRAKGSDPGRLYVVEPALTVTGSVADHRLAVRRSDHLPLALALLAEVRRMVPSSPAWTGALGAGETRLPDSTRRWVSAAARDLVVHGGQSVVVAGPAQSAATHAIACALNAALESRCVTYVAPAVVGAGTPSFSVEPLLAEIDAGNVDLLIMLGGNPAYTAPPDAELARRLQRVRDRVYLAPYENETARVANWLVPAAHFLESWDDAAALDGTTSFAQPLVRPLYGGQTAAELVAALLGRKIHLGRDLLLESGRRSGHDFEHTFREALRAGVLKGSEAKALIPSPRPQIAPVMQDATPNEGIEITFQEDCRVRDGAFSNDAWLLELPDPITELTWGNAARLSAVDARAMGATTGDLVSLRIGERALTAPAIITPGQAEGSIALALGYGRGGSETLARGVGFDAGRLRTLGALWNAANVEVRRVGRAPDLAIVQTHDSMEGRDPAIDVSIADLKRGKDSLAHARAALPTLYDKFPHTGPQWGMTIDLDSCTGCQTCVVACQAENNIPVVGAEGVLKGRIMHWLRIDRYFEDSEGELSVRHQPLACVHCEKAPCEYVCPVGATVHSEDGLNEMVYNRCVGTRFCSNNCPYKVRRFNWFDYHRDTPETVRMAMNPDVTVRARGVMEKCTYCVQRIRESEIKARTAGRPLEDGEIRTACEQACPSAAITFGDITDPESRVSRQRESPRAYALLNELGTLPRTRYLARARHPNPELAR